MLFITIIGLLAAFLTTAAYLPQVVKSWKTKQTKDISLPMYTLLVVGVAIWLIYGFLIRDIPIVASNILIFAFSFVTLVLKIKNG